MGRDIAISGWSEEWLNRTLPELKCETTLVVYAITLTSLFIGIRALLRVRRTRKDLEANPSNRVAILSGCDKRMAKTTKTIFCFAHIFFFHSLALWFTDAAIGVLAIYQDVDSHPGEYTAPVWIDLAIQVVTMLAVFTAVFIAFPMLQLIGVSHLVKKSVRKGSEAPMSAYITEGRIISTHLAQLWMMTGFCIVSWWPVMESSMLRIVILEAVFGSGIAWLSTSFIFNFRTDALYKMEMEVLQQHQRPVGVCQHVVHYGKQVAASFEDEKSQLLPKYEQAAQDEKTGL
ncbi:hypothetical protein M409DRAFT_50155 [Zasmidium cellare ATCC 36951]|uniref:Uncharacterized protein n=1 Tax=Zasmidium cellare ATCC 36951 TaxID=1080233 RepID=A0A6A6D218_ZASCE|nr:uncharacterized protein M409DRAFT_50155 [Zasmidium cellare ATCC 36951]KAF2172460.1 hypothetical protein M409DRAFT_50155 [Zasmidium cellare ATCC 36951]